MTTKHTPGPWTVDAHDTPLIINEGATGYAIAILAEKDDSTVSTEEANARLIAAAPELLAALEEIAFQDQRDGRFAEIARAAIAKAEGR